MGGKNFTIISKYVTLYRRFFSGAENLLCEEIYD